MRNPREAAKEQLSKMHETVMDWVSDERLSHIDSVSERGQSYYGSEGEPGKYSPPPKLLAYAASQVMHEEGIEEPAPDQTKPDFYKRVVNGLFPDSKKVGPRLQEKQRQFFKDLFRQIQESTDHPENWAPQLHPENIKDFRNIWAEEVAKDGASSVQAAQLIHDGGLHQLEYRPHLYESFFGANLVDNSETDKRKTKDDKEALPAGVYYAVDVMLKLPDEQLDELAKAAGPRPDGSEELLDRLRDSERKPKPAPEKFETRPRVVDPREIIEDVAYLHETHIVPKVKQGAEKSRSLSRAEFRELRNQIVDKEIRNFLQGEDGEAPNEEEVTAYKQAYKVFVAKQLGFSG